MTHRKSRTRRMLRRHVSTWGPIPWAVVFVGCSGAAALLGGLAPGLTAVAGSLGAMALMALAGFGWALARSRSFEATATLLTAASEGSSEALMITDAEGGLVYTNAAFHRLFVLATSLDAIAVIIEGEEGAEAFARLRANATSGVADRAEIPLRIPAGGIEWRDISMLPIHGHPGFALWRSEDITARREIEAIRRREDEMQADFLDNLPGGFFSVDGEGRILHANQTLAAWLGVAAEEMRSRRQRFADFVVDSRSAPAPGDDDGVESHGEVTLRAVDGHTFPAILVQSGRVDDEGEMTYTRSLLLRDMAWRTPDAGRNSERRLHSLFDEAPVGVVLVDLRGEVADCNRAFLKLIGLHRDAVVGMPFAERVNKEDRDDIAAQLSKVVMGTMRAAHLEDVRVPGAGERELVTSLYASRLEDDANEVSGLVLHIMDTTEQKHLEVQFAQSQKMQAIGQLAGGVAHDFNNLLTAMIGFCDLLLGRHGPEDPSFADIMQIKQNANRATNLVRQLLAFSRKQTLQPVMMDPAEALGDLSNLLRRLIGENIELVMDLAPDGGLIRADRVQFDQVIINMAVNARDAMTGGGTLSIRTLRIEFAEPVHKGHELIPSGAYIVIEVTDTGVGIPKENMIRIFEPFFSTKEVGAGTGLGLSTVYGIVRQSDGFIFVDSAPGQGAKFTIYLPAYNPAEVSPAEPPRAMAEKDTAAADLTGAGTVLLVEDEDAVRMFGARALRNKGYQVLEAHHGEAALDVINSTPERIDLIISDVVMPGMDGHTLVRLVRHELPEVKVILISGYAEDALSEEIGRDTTIDFLPKPFSLKDLATKVKEVMGRP